jgi:hypothetical protein
VGRENMRMLGRFPRFLEPEVCGVYEGHLTEVCCVVGVAVPVSMSAILIDVVPAGRTPYT